MERRTGQLCLDRLTCSCVHLSVRMSARAGILCSLVLASVVLGASSGSSHECQRPCKVGQPPKKCNYVFTLQSHVTLSRKACGDCPRNESDCYQPNCVTPISDKVRTFFSVNRELPGPAIQVCLGDTVEVEVRNRLPAGAEGALHWHGIPQTGSPHMDGVPMLTQCPVPPVLQQIDGIYGALIVRDSTYEHDDDQVLVISPWTEELQSGVYGVLHGDLLRQATPTALLINGRGTLRKENDETVQLAHATVTAGKPALLRLINAAALDCPVQVTLPSHLMRVRRIADAAVKTVTVKSIQIFPGERYDVEVLAQHPGEFKLLVQGNHTCQATPTLQGILHVLASNLKKTRQIREVSLTEYESMTSECVNSSKSTLCSLDLEAATELPLWSSEANLAFSLPFGRAPVSPVNEDDLEFRFVLDDVAYYPTFLQDTAASDCPRLHPSFTLKTRRQWLAGSARVCLHMTRRLRRLHEDQEELVKIRLTIASVLTSSELLSTPRCISRCVTQIKKSKDCWRATEDTEWRHVTRPVLRDTVVVPRGGAVKLRLLASNPGFWLLEARAGHIASAGVGVAAVLQVGDRTLMPPVPKDFPRCSGIKPEDVIF
ncbi:hypothetical protein B566_EDAN008802 [Ephemera danica]|nr:hypothetical protein B566_EDAN008802 [Ephemera danica]